MVSKRFVLFLFLPFLLFSCGRKGANLEEAIQRARALPLSQAPDFLEAYVARKKPEGSSVYLYRFVLDESEKPLSPVRVLLWPEEEHLFYSFGFEKESTLAAKEATSVPSENVYKAVSINFSSAQDWTSFEVYLSYAEGGKDVETRFALPLSH